MAMQFGFGSGEKRGLRAESGMSAVEFALLLPLMLLIVCGIMGFGNLYYQMNIVSNAAREAARRYAMSAATRPTEATVQGDLRAAYDPNNQYSLTVQPWSISGNSVTATVTETVPLLSAYIGTRIPNFPTTISGRCVMRVEP